jgi:uncharacterized protein YbjT (DUF2867 family)
MPATRNAENHRPAGPVLVTGATGNVGQEVVRALRARGVPVRAASPSPDRIRRLFGERLDAVRLDLQDPSTFAAALRGASALFLLRPPAIADMRRTLNPLVDAARKEGLDPIVFLSVAGANRLMPHHAVEAHLAHAGGTWTVLRPGFFAQNLGDAYRRDIVEEGRLYVPAGQARVTFVDVRDVAEVAAQAFLDPRRYHGRIYTLTGPEPVSFATAAELLSAALGRPIRYQSASITGYVRHLHRRGLPMGQIAVQTLLHVAMRRGQGQAQAVDPVLAMLLRRPARTLREYVNDHVGLWQSTG